MKNLENTRAVVIYLSKYVSGKTLDYGAGTAKYKSILSTKSEEYLSFDKFRTENVDVVGDVLNAPFNRETFDTVISTQVLEHVQKPWVMVENIRHILKTGGICIAAAPFLIPYHADPDDFFRFTQQGIEALFTHNGFEILESGKYGRAASVLIDMVYFSLFDHYKSESRAKTWVKTSFFTFLKKIAFRLDNIFKGTDVYENVYIVARKI